jgi:hypothetical protein
MRIGKAYQNYPNKSDKFWPWQVILLLNPGDVFLNLIGLGQRVGRGNLSTFNRHPLSTEFGTGSFFRVILYIVPI